jgi:hypothetical protein
LYSSSGETVPESKKRKIEEISSPVLAAEAPETEAKAEKKKEKKGLMQLTQKRRKKRSR